MACDYSIPPDPTKSNGWRPDPQKSTITFYGAGLHPLIKAEAHVASRDGQILSRPVALVVSAAESVIAPSGVIAPTTQTHLFTDGSSFFDGCMCVSALTHQLEARALWAPIKRQFLEGSMTRTKTIAMLWCTALAATLAAYGCGSSSTIDTGTGGGPASAGHTGGGQGGNGIVIINTGGMTGAGGDRRHGAV